MKNGAKRKRLVVGNWKMNPSTLEEAKKIFRGIKRVSVKNSGVEVAVCPPYPFIQTLSRSVEPVHMGAQDVFEEESGSFTGQVSAKMLRAVGCEYVIIGHSEKRAMGETNEVVARKIESSLKEGLKVIVCVGEKERDQNGEYLTFLKNQITESLAKVNKKTIKQIVVAYEPVWAVGKNYNNAMAGKDVQEISIFIKKILADSYGKDESAQTLILYGGSVAPINARDIAEQGQIDGFLVGRQSLEAVNFGEIISIVAKA